MLKNILVLSFLFFAVAAQGQLFLKIEKIGSPYFNKRIYPGQTLVFKVQGDENWRTSELIELISETQLLVFEDQAHPIDEILFLRDDKRSTWSKPPWDFLNHLWCKLVFLCGHRLYLWWYDQVHKKRCNSDRKYHPRGLCNPQIIQTQNLSDGKELQP